MSVDEIMKKYKQRTPPYWPYSESLVRQVLAQPHQRGIDRPMVQMELFS